jgi:2'-5' RNA ligase
MAAPKKYEHINFVPPEGVANAAEKGLKLRAKASPSNRGGLTPAEASKQGIGSGVQRAVNLKNRDPVSPKVVKQMRDFLSRSEKSSEISEENKGTPWNDKGYVAWLLWGGDPAKAWVAKIIGQMEAADEKAKQSKQAALMGKWGSFLCPTIREAGLLQPPPQMTEEITNWVLSCWAKTVLAIYKAKGKRHFNERYMERLVKGDSKAAVIRRGSPEKRRFPMDLTGWRYGDRSERIFQKEIASIAERMDMFRSAPGAAMMKEYLDSMEQTQREYLDSGMPLLVEIEHKPKQSGNFTAAMNRIYISFHSETTEEWLRKAVAHEMRHYAQALLTQSIEHSTGTIEAGLPSRSIRTPQYSQNPSSPHAETKSYLHALDDVEFYTNLADAVERMRMLLQAIPEEYDENTGKMDSRAREARFKELVGYRIGSDTLSFFKNLKRNRKAHGKWKKAVSEAYAALVDDVFSGGGSRFRLAARVVERWASDNEPSNPGLWAKVQALTKGEKASITVNGKKVNGPNDGKGFTVFPCVPVDGAEALTRQGWRSYEELHVGDEIVTYNKDSDCLEWGEIRHLHHHTEAPVIRLHKAATCFDFVCTADHKWVIKQSPRTGSVYKPRARKYPDQLVSADQITQNMKIITSAVMADSDPVPLCGFRKHDWSWVERVLAMSHEQREAWLASAIVYDGHEIGYSERYGRCSYGFSQKDPDHAEATAICAFLLGYNVSFRKKKHNPSMMSYTFIDRRTHSTGNVIKEDAGVADVWCPQTDNQTWVMRQGRMVTITGNSAYANGWASKTYKDLGGKWKKKASTGDGSEHVGVFAPLPADLAGQFPEKGEDSSVAHVTLCYIGPVPDKQDQKVLVESVRDLYADVVGPIKARLSGVDYFRSATGSVAYTKVVFSKDMGSLKDRLKSLLEDHGIEISDDHPLAFNPHVTLAYYEDPHAVWDGPVPKGSWTFNEVEVWGLPEVHRLPVGRKDKMESEAGVKHASLCEAWGPTLREARGKWKKTGAAAEDCDAMVSTAWVSPQGKMVFLRGQSHEDFAEKWALRNEPELHSRITEYAQTARPHASIWHRVLLDRGWLQLQGMSSIVVPPRPSRKQLQNVADLFANCIADGTSNPDRITLHIMGLDPALRGKAIQPGEDRYPFDVQERVSLADFIEREASGPVIEDMYESLMERPRRASLREARGKAKKDVGPGKIARKSPLDDALVQSFRKDFLLLAKAAERVSTLSAVKEVASAVNKWRVHFETFATTLRKDLESRLRSAKQPRGKYNPNPPDLNDLEHFLERGGLEKLWNFAWEVGRIPSGRLTLKNQFGSEWEPPEQALAKTVQFWRDRGESLEEAERLTQRYFSSRSPWTKEEAEAAVVNKWKGEARKWARRARDKARPTWALLKQVAEWSESFRGGQRPVEFVVPEEEVVSMSGFRVVFRGFAESPYQDKLPVVREALKRLRTRAQTRAPILLKKVVPIHIQWTFEPGAPGNAAAYYERGMIYITPWVIDKNIDRLVWVLAHEMGHHLYKTVLSNEARRDWSSFIWQTYTDLDLRDVLRRLEKHSVSSWVNDNTLADKDPILYLQLWGLSEVINDRFLSAKDIREYLDEGGDPEIRVMAMPISGYAHKNPEEAFCEALGKLVAYGSKAVPDIILGMLRQVLPTVRIASLTEAWGSTLREAARAPFDNSFRGPSEGTARLSDVTFEVRGRGRFLAVRVRSGDGLLGEIEATLTDQAQIRKHVDGPDRTDDLGPHPEKSVAGSLRDLGERVGRPDMGVYTVGSSNLWDTFHGYGVGKRAYMVLLREAYKRGHAVGPDASWYGRGFSATSPNAQRVWKKLGAMPGVEVAADHPFYYGNPKDERVGPDRPRGFRREKKRYKRKPKHPNHDRVARGKAKKDVGHGGLDEWFSGHGGAKGKGEDATWGDWVSISPVTKTLPSGKKVEKGDIVGECGISDDADWKEITKGGEDPLKCMPRQKAHDTPKKERAEKAKAKQRAEKADSSRGKKPTMTPTFDKKKGKKARGYRQVPTKSLRLDPSVVRFLRQHGGVFKEYPNLWIKGGGARDALINFYADRAKGYQRSSRPLRDIDLVLIGGSHSDRDELLARFGGSVESEDLDTGARSMGGYLRSRDVGINEVALRPDFFVFTDKALRDLSRNTVNPSGGEVDPEWGDVSPRLGLRSVLFSLREGLDLPDNTMVTEAVHAARPFDLLIHLYKAFETGVEDSFFDAVSGNDNLGGARTAEEALLLLHQGVYSFSRTPAQEAIYQDAVMISDQDAWEDRGKKARLQRIQMKREASSRLRSAWGNVQ